MPFGAEVAVVELLQLHRDPRLEVHAVGDRSDRHLGFGQIGPDATPHLPAHLAMEGTDAVGVRRRAQAEDRVAELLAAVAAIATTHGEQLLGADSGGRGQPAEVAFDQGRGEVVVAGGYGSVGGEHQPGGCLASRGEVEPAAIHQLPDELQNQER